MRRRQGAPPACSRNATVPCRPQLLLPRPRVTASNAPTRALACVCGGGGIVVIVPAAGSCGAKHAPQLVRCLEAADIHGEQRALLALRAGDAGRRRADFGLQVAPSSAAHLRQHGIQVVLLLRRKLPLLAMRSPHGREARARLLWRGRRLLRRGRRVVALTPAAVVVPFFVKAVLPCFVLNTMRSGGTLCSCSES